VDLHLLLFIFYLFAWTDIVLVVRACLDGLINYALGFWFLLLVGVRGEDGGERGGEAESGADTTRPASAGGGSTGGRPPRALRTLRPF